MIATVYILSLAMFQVTSDLRKLNTALAQQVPDGENTDLERQLKK